MPSPKSSPNTVTKILIQRCKENPTVKISTMQKTPTMSMFHFERQRPLYCYTIEWSILATNLESYLETLKIVSVTKYLCRHFEKR